MLFPLLPLFPRTSRFTAQHELVKQEWNQINWVHSHLHIGAPLVIIAQ